MRATRGALRLERLGPEHAAAILAGQDAALAAEIVGAPWTRQGLDEFLTRCARWRADGPIREFAAVGERGAQPLGGGGLQLRAPGLERGQAALTYWLLAARRGSGLGHALAAALVEQARADARVTQLVLRIAPTNIASRAVARGLGARRTGMQERHPADVRRSVDRWLLDLR